MDRPRRSDCTAGQMDGEAGWWTTSGSIGLPPLARVMGVGRQQQQQDQTPPPIHRIPAPSTIFRLDRFEHFPRNGGKRGRCRRCKNGYTQIACTKCNVTVLYKGQQLLLRVSHYEMTLCALLTHSVMLVRVPHKFISSFFGIVQFGYT